MVLRSVGILSSGKMMGAIYGVLGLIMGGFFMLFSLLGVAFPQANQANGANHAPLAIGMGIAFAIFIPIAYAIMGFIGGVIVAAVYNLVAGIAGGLELEFERPGNVIAAP